MSPDLSDPASLSIAEAGAALRSGALSSVALTEAALAQIEAWEDAVHAFITPTPELALARAAQADAERAAGIDLGPLHGIPYGLKDIYDTAGLRTTCASALMADHIPQADSHVAEALARAGGVLMGKLNTYEFAMGDRFDEVPFPPANNPWKLDRVTPGSSSGSGVAIATQMMRLATGSDTGGSIRLPASCCGTVGLKPTFGRVSRSGVHPFSESCDHAGLLTGDITDMAIGMQLISGHDPADPFSADVPVPDFRAGLGQGLAGLRIGIDRAFVEGPGLGDVMWAEFDRVTRLLRAEGAEVVDVTLPPAAHFSACGAATIGVEGLATHAARLRRHTGPETRNIRRYFLPALGVTALDYLEAQRLRARLRAGVDAALQQVDAILCVTTDGSAVPYLPMPDMSTFGRTGAFNLTGHPALTLPTGLDPEGLPLSVQLVGRAFEEPLLLRIGHGLEAACGWRGTGPVYPPRA